MTTDSAISPSADDAALEVSARLASGVAHELGGLLFALRLRLETLAAAAPPDSPDVAALELGFREIQGVVEAVRLLGTRAGTGRLVRERAVTAGSWLTRLRRLARYVVPRGVEIVGSDPETGAVELGAIDLRRLTEGALLALAHVASPPGVRAVVVELAVDETEHRLVLRLRPERPTTSKPAEPAMPSAFLRRARRLVKALGGRIRSGPEPGRAIEIVVDLRGGGA
jgi:hypothetical protein